MNIDPRAGKPAEPRDLVDVSKLTAAYYAERPDPAVPGQRVSFGTSGHRGSAFDGSFNENHILAIAQAICLHRQHAGVTGLLFIGMPVAFSFIAINLIGAILFLGGEAGIDQLVRNSSAAVMNFSLTPIPLFILMGEVLFHTGLAIKVVEAVERLDVGAHRLRIVECG